MGNAGYGNHTEDTKGTGGSERPDPHAPRTGSPETKPGAPPAVGPHGKPSLTNPDATPGAGSLPEIGDRDGTDSTSS